MAGISAPVLSLKVFLEPHVSKSGSFEVQIDWCTHAVFLMVAMLCCLKVVMCEGRKGRYRALAGWMSDVSLITGESRKCIPAAMGILIYLS